MASWDEFETQAPQLAEAIRTRLDAHKHKMLATLRRDGSPRLSGVEVSYFEGQLWIGMMPNSLKGADLRRDPRFALHSAPVDLDLAAGDAKLSGTAELADDGTVRRIAALMSDDGSPPPPGAMDLFRCELLEASLVQVDGNELLLTSWRAGQPARERRRE
jgi:hypothetical protein